MFYNLAKAYAAQHDNDRAFEWLQRAKATARVDMSQIEADEDLKPLAGDRRFASMLPTIEDFANPFVETVQVIREWNGEGMNDQFGWIARNIGDVDADGVPDVVTSAPTSNVGGRTPDASTSIPPEPENSCGRLTAGPATSWAPASRARAIPTATAFRMSLPADPVGAWRTCTGP